MTDSARERERLREEIYGEWAKMKEQGYTRRSAIPVLAYDYGLSVPAVTRMITKSDQIAGVKPVRSVASDELREAAWSEFVILRNQGYSWYNACDQLGRKYGKHWQTINNWMRELKNIKKSDI